MKPGMALNAYSLCHFLPSTGITELELGFLGALMKYTLLRRSRHQCIKTSDPVRQILDFLYNPDRVWVFAYPPEDLAPGVGNREGGNCVEERGLLFLQGAVALHWSA